MIFVPFTNPYAAPTARIPLPLESGEYSQVDNTLSPDGHYYYYA